MTSMQDAQVLVTGATGMVGSALLRQLVESGFARVRALYRGDAHALHTGGPGALAEWHACDVLDVVGLEEAMQGVEVVFHCAGSIYSRGVDARTMWQVNVEGTANVVNAALAAGVRRIVHVGSVATLMREGHLLIDEAAEWEPGTRAGVYAESKHRAEMEVWRGMAEGLEAVVVLPSYVLAAGFWDRGAMQLFGRVYRGLKWYPRGGAGFVDARDVARFMVQAAQEAPSGSRYILSAANLSWQELLTGMAEALQVPPPTRPLPAWADPVVVVWSWLRSRLVGKEHAFTARRMRQLATHYRYDSSRSLTLNGFRYRPFRETLRDLAAAFLDTQSTRSK